MSFADNVAVAANVAQILGAVGTVGGIFYAAAQLRHNASTSRATFLLELEKMSRDHDAVHTKLRPDGTWTKKGAGPQNDEEWMQLEDYMGFFEHCEVLMQQGSLDPRVFRSLFGYRLENILENKLIVKEKLIDERNYWQLFWALLQRLRLTHRVAQVSDDVSELTQVAP